MQTLDSFIIERLKLNKDTKISPNYVYFIWPRSENFHLLRNISYNNSDQSIIKKTASKGGVVAYICDIDFFNDNIKKKWNFDEYKGEESVIFKISTNDIDNIIKSWKAERRVSKLIEKLENKYKNINSYENIR